MSLLDDDLNVDSVVLVDAILNYIKSNTYLNHRIKWNVVIDDDITDYMNNPESYYLYHTVNILPNNTHMYIIYIYSPMHIRPSYTFAVVNKRYKHVNLKRILDYESTR